MEAIRRRTTPLLILSPHSRLHSPAWQPPVDVYRTRSGWLVKLELAGIRPSDVVVTATDHRLKVEGARRDFTVERGCVHHTMEIRYSRFERYVELPCDLRHCALGSTYEDGLLLIHVTPQVMSSKGQAHD